ncbi:MAG: IMP cyclohydrolase [Methanobacterium sp.]|jgi:IMP cyclohydrolase
MYLGRMLAVGSTNYGKFSAYRVSSRSFPNRATKGYDDRVSVIPREGFEKDIFKNPYIAYNCIKIVDDVAVVSNGSQTDIIAEKISSGMNIRDALGLTLLTMDYEKDDYKTPRIAGATSLTGDAYLGIVTHDTLIVEKVPDGKAAYIATYEHIKPKIVEFCAEDGDAAAEFILNGAGFAEFTNPVTSAAAFGKNSWSISTL